MNYRTLGKTGLEVSEISLGCWALGGPGQSGWGAIDEKEIIEAVNFAVDSGVNHFDNADSYGEGNAERLLAKALGEKSKKVFISSKVGWVKGTAEWAYEPAHIRHQCEQSLVNLKRECIDIYYFHHGDFGENDRYLAEAVPVMEKLKREGKIRFIGLSTYSEADFLRLGPAVKPDVLQGSCNAMNTSYIREGSKTEEYMKRENIRMVGFSPFVHGLLIGKYTAKNPPKFEEGDFRSRSEYFKPESLAKNDERMEKIKGRFGSETKDIARAMLQYLLSYEAVGTIIPGFRNRRQVELNLSAAGKPITAEEKEFVRKVFEE